MAVSLYTTEECEKIAAEASLRYVSNQLPGIERRMEGSTFIYYDAKGKRITDEHIISRINLLAIPPAYKNVWICSYANGHIQATGIDDKNRVQYIYHSLWNEVRQQQKFDTLIDFGHCLSKIRRHVQYQLRKNIQLDKKQVLCAIIYLLDKANIRIGNSLYAKKNHSYGITTLRKKHLLLKNKEAVLNFPGKNSQVWHVILKDKRLIKLLKKCEEIPGYELFKYYNEQGTLNVVTSQEVNGYLKGLTHHPFTAKTFRTWIACRETFCRLIKEPSSPAQFKSIIKEVAIILGHTPAVCRKNYIDPEMIRWWEKGLLSRWIKKQNISLKNKDKLFLFWLENRGSL